jgi:hypothetical protein
MLIVCAWCKETIGELDDGAEIEGCPRVSHGICDDCRRRERRAAGLDDEDTQPEVHHDRRNPQ